MIIGIELDEMPTDCYECPLQIKFKDGVQDDLYMRRCVVKNRVIEYPKPEWCPLKEQEAKQAIKQTYHVMMNRDYENPVEVTRYDWLCPTCKSLLCRDIDVIDDNYHFCKVCGQAVKWDE